jgi:multidrug efflux pump subunit AcrB
MEGGYAAIYETPNYRRFRRLIVWSVEHKFLVAGAVVIVFFAAAFGMGFVKQQFFPTSDRPEVLIDITLPQGSSIEATQATVSRVEHWLRAQPETKIVSSYIGGGAPRFWLAYNPDLPVPNFAKMMVMTPSPKDRDKLILRFRQQVASGLAPEARLRANKFVFGPYSPWPIAFRVSGPDPNVVRTIADQVLTKMQANPNVRQANEDWNERAPVEHFALDQDRLRLIGLSSYDVAQQIQFLTTGLNVTQVREGIRTVDVVARTSGLNRLDPSKLLNLSLTSNSGRLIPLNQIGKVTAEEEDPILKRRDRVPTMNVESDLDESLQPPQVTAEITKAIQPIVANLPPGYGIQAGANEEDSAKANDSIAKMFPIMLVCMLVVIVVQVRSLSALAMTILTAPLGLAGVVPTLLLFNVPFGFNAILGLIALAGILMRNTLILIGQIKTNKEEGLDDFHAVVEATVQRSRPVVLTALAAVLAFVPLTYSVFWGSLAYTLIGGTAVGTVLTLVFLPALYTIWFRVKPSARATAEEAQLVF